MKINRLISHLSAKNTQPKEQLKNNSNWTTVGSALILVHATVQQKEVAAISGGGNMFSKERICLASGL